MLEAMSVDFNPAGGATRLLGSTSFRYAHTGADGPSDLSASREHVLSRTWRLIGMAFAVQWYPTRLAGALAAQIGGRVVRKPNMPGRAGRRGNRPDPTRFSGLSPGMGRIQAGCRRAIMRGTLACHGSVSQVRELPADPEPRAKLMRTEGKAEFRGAKLGAQPGRRVGAQRGRSARKTIGACCFEPLEMSPASYCRSASRTRNMRISPKVEARWSASQTLRPPGGCDRAEEGCRE
jgi:hypothetical protein